MIQCPVTKLTGHLPCDPGLKRVGRNEEYCCYLPLQLPLVLRAIAERLTDLTSVTRIGIEEDRSGSQYCAGLKLYSHSYLMGGIGVSMTKPGTTHLRQQHNIQKQKTFNFTSRFFLRQTRGGQITTLTMLFVTCVSEYHTKSLLLVQAFSTTTGKTRKRNLVSVTTIWRRSLR